MASASPDTRAASLTELKGDGREVFIVACIALLHTAITSKTYIFGDGDDGGLSPAGISRVCKGLFESTIKGYCKKNAHAALLNAITAYATLHPLAHGVATLTQLPHFASKANEDDDEPDETLAGKGAAALDDLPSVVRQ
jgi:hypothetical protein